VLRRRNIKLSDIELTVLSRPRDTHRCRIVGHLRMRLTAPARTSTLSAQVARQLEQLITSGEWPIGKRIPAESELVAQLGLSRNTVREALRSLVHTGMLEARVGDGTYVSALSELQTPFVRRVNRARLEDAIELRAVLERSAAGLAARRCDARQATQLRKLVNALRVAGLAGDPSAFVAADSALHETILACARNALFTEVYEHLGRALKLSANPQLWDQALVAKEIGLHEALVDAIAKGDEGRAESAATSLVDSLWSALLPEAHRARAGK
jgi:DNA-binding FadR family transcriptional regulator